MWSTSFDAVVVIAALLVPGFITDATLGMFVPSTRPPEWRGLLRYLTLSLLNYASWGWFFVIPYGREAVERHGAATALALVALPAILGMVLGIMSGKEPIRRVLLRFGINPIHVVPTAWDYKFSRGETRYVLVTLRDGSSVAGLIGPRSFVSTCEAERDLYLEAVFLMGGERPWARHPRTDGILLKGSEIRSIEFFTATQGDAHVTGREADPHP